MLRAILLLSTFSFTNAAPPVFRPFTTQEHQLSFAPARSPTDEVKYQLRLAEIVPTVLPAFQPEYILQVNWSRSIFTDLGNTLDPTDLGKFPNFGTYLPADAPGLGDTTRKKESIANYVFALTDPDAPARDDPAWSEVCHSLVYFRVQRNVLETQNLVSLSEDSNRPPYNFTAYIVTPYKAPAPPPKTGKHRYVFTLLAPTNGTSEFLYPTKPKERSHWGYSEIRVGLQKWAKNNGFSVVAANFFYAQNKVQ